MKPTVYIETTVISYLTAWDSRDIIRLSHQLLTREWWANARPRFELYTSALVQHEAAEGDPAAAADRLKTLKDIPLVIIDGSVMELAAEIAAAISLPKRAQADAVHVAAAAVHGIAFLLTWNCRHLANGELVDRIERVCFGAGFNAPRILTPELLMEPI
jgi:predicted nucleic acid-binding protein